MPEARQQMPATKWLMIIGGAAGLVLPIFFAVMWALAAVVNGHWVLGRDTLSELGGQVPSRWIFNVAVIVSGVLGIDFSFRLFVKFADSRLGRAGSVVLAIASIGLVSVGVFPIDTGQPHTIASVFFFTVVALSVLILLHPVYKWVGAKSVPFIVQVAAILLSLVSFALTPLPFAEAVTVASLQAFILAAALELLRENGWRLATS